jgi:hypothetical protein
MLMVWRDGRIRVDINGREVAPFAPDAAPLVLRGTAAPPSVPSYEDPAAAATCRSAVDRRPDRFAARRPLATPEKRRALSRDEQVDELRAALDVLREDLADRVRFRRRLPDVAARLRALLVWNKGPTYNPLLLRLADQAGIALPMYAIPSEPLPIAADRIIRFDDDGQPSIIRTLRGHRLMDVEDWLTRPAATHLVVDPTGAAAKDEFTNMRLIEKAASTVGTFHCDETVPILLDELQTTVELDVELLTRYLARIGHVVVELGEYVLRELDRMRQSAEPES